MCEIGSAIDYGKFEGASVRFECDTWKQTGLLHAEGSSRRVGFQR